MSGWMIGILIGYVLFNEVRWYLQMRVNEQALDTITTIRKTLESWKPFIDSKPKTEGR